MLSFDLVNVFIADGEHFTGNPLAVFYGAENLTQAQCQALGRQLNLSEITFPSKITEDSYDVRIFTPADELPFAGHPTLGTCFALLQRGLNVSTGKATQTSLSGQTYLSFDTAITSPFKPARIRMQAAPKFITERLSTGFDRLPALLGHSHQRVKCVRRASCGLPWQYALVDSPDAVVNCKINMSELLSYIQDLSNGQLTPEEKGVRFVPGIVVYAVAGQEGDETVIKARVFFSETGTLTEDSATGSAALGLGLALFKEGIITAESPKYKVLQGYEALKPSQLYGRVIVDNGAASAVSVAGYVVKVGQGEVSIPRV